MTESDIVAKAIAALDTVRESWLSRQEVVGCDVGYNYVDGVRTDEIVLRAHVHWPADNSQPTPFPEKVGDFRVIIIEANYGFDEAESE